MRFQKDQELPLYHLYENASSQLKPLAVSSKNNEYKDTDKTLII